MTPTRLLAPSDQRTRAAAHLVARRLADRLLRDPHAAGAGVKREVV
jgi:hypothetical protein